MFQWLRSSTFVSHTVRILSWEALAGSWSWNTERDSPFCMISNDSNIDKATKIQLFRPELRHGVRTVWCWRAYRRDQEAWKVSLRLVIRYPRYYLLSFGCGFLRVRGPDTFIVLELRLTRTMFMILSSRFDCWHAGFVAKIQETLLKQHHGRRSINFLDTMCNFVVYKTSYHIYSSHPPYHHHLIMSTFTSTENCCNRKHQTACFKGYSAMLSRIKRQTEA